MEWLKRPAQWIDGDVLFISIPFTWNLPAVKRHIMQKSIEYKSVFVGGPAVNLMPGFFDCFDFVIEGHHMPGMLQRFNAHATRTSTGCVRQCAFCAVPKTEGKLFELPSWPIACVQRRAFRNRDL